MSYNQDDIAIDVQNISKSFRTYERPIDRLKEFIIPKIQRMFGLKQTHYFREFFALKDISFQVKRGGIVGVVGRNGAGKSTLLQILTGTLSQTSGSVKINGRVAALLELGSGFNPEFSGLENIYINASLVGLSKKEIDSKLDDIINFSEIGDFIDQPVKTYSSGMLVRLAFSVYSQINPEILIIDEALSVGDAKFQRKCFSHLQKLINKGTTIFFVSHSTEQIVTHCNFAFLIEGGKIIQTGEPKTVVNKYLDILFGDQNVSEIKKDKNEPLLNISKGVFENRPFYNANEYRWGNQKAQFIDYVYSSNNKEFPPVIHYGDDIDFYFDFIVHESLLNPIFGFAIKTVEGITLYNTNSKIQKTGFDRILDKDKVYSVHIKLPIFLQSGNYFVSIGIVSEPTPDELIPYDRRYDSIIFSVENPSIFGGIFDMKSKISNIRDSKK